MRLENYSQVRNRASATHNGACPTPDARPKVCCTAALERLGPVLCVYPVSDEHPLCGWERARDAVHHAWIESDGGPMEALVFLDANGQPCWRLGLLPDTDYLQWDRLVEPLTHSAAAPAMRRLPLWSRCGVAGAISTPVWKACPLRLHAIDVDAVSQRLAASCATLSQAGRQACRYWVDL